MFFNDSLFNSSDIALSMEETCRVVHRRPHSPSHVDARVCVACLVPPGPLPASGVGEAAALAHVPALGATALGARASEEETALIVDSVRVDHKVSASAKRQRQESPQSNAQVAVDTGERRANSARGAQRVVSERDQKLLQCWFLVALGAPSRVLRAPTLRCDATARRAGKSVRRSLTLAVRLLVSKSSATTMHRVAVSPVEPMKR